MKLYLIERIDGAAFDETGAAVIAAGTRSEARKIAKAELTGDQDNIVWLDPNESTLREIGTARISTEPGVVLYSFHAG